jgi:hypothetical protein
MSPLSGPPYRGGSSSITLAWSNERWLRITGGRSLNYCMETRVHNMLEEWIEEDDEEESVFTLNLLAPATTLHLSKTVLPFTPLSTTRAFCVVTSQARRPDQSGVGAFEPSSPGVRSSTSADLHSSFSTQRPSMSSSELRMSVSTDMSNHSGQSDQTESYFPPASERSGSSRSRYRGRAAKERESVNLANMVSAAEEYWALLEGFDWSKTKLGPTSGWVEAIGPLLSVTFQSKTMDSLWLGEDLVMI